MTRFFHDLHGFTYEKKLFFEKIFNYENLFKRFVIFSHFIYKGEWGTTLFRWPTESRPCGVLRGNLDRNTKTFIMDVDNSKTKET